MPVVDLTRKSDTPSLHAQMPSRPETKSSKKRATMKQSGDWHSKFSKIGSQDIVANVLAHLPIK